MIDSKSNREIRCSVGALNAHCTPTALRAGKEGHLKCCTSSALPDDMGPYGTRRLASIYNYLRDSPEHFYQFSNANGLVSLQVLANPNEAKQRVHKHLSSAWNSSTSDYKFYMKHTWVCVLIILWLLSNLSLHSKLIKHSHPHENSLFIL